MKQEKKEIKAYAEKAGEKLIAIASSETTDRTGDSLKIAGWQLENFKKNPVIPFAHNYAEPPVGIAKNIHVEGKNLIFEPVFHEFTQLAREVKAMFESEPPIMRAFSVGFIPLEADQKDAHTITKQELLEISAVPVPANQEALTVVAKSYTKQDKEKVCKWIDGQLQCKEMANEIKPYPTEHSCRLKDPGKFKAGSFRSIERKHDDKKYRIIMGKLKGETTMTEQGYRYDKGTWSVDSAKAHCKSHDGIKFEPASEEKAEEKETYKCECLDCGHTVETEEHCKDTKCPKCGGEMRRAERPGIGKEIKERWNKQLPVIFDSKEFDIANETSRVTTFEYKLYTGYLDCEVRHLNLNNFLIPSPLLGSYLAGFKEILGKYKVIDERNFDYYGQEEPINYEVIKLNSKEEDDFLVKGTVFYENDTGNKKFVVKFQPCYYGLQAQIITTREDREWSKNLLIKVKEWVKENNKLRGEAFCLSGEFIKRGDTKWESIILPDTIKGAIMKGVTQLEKKGKDSVNRGMMFIGKPGTGKTLTGKAMMSNLKDKTFIWLSARDFEIMRYARRDALSLAFDLVRQLSPVVLFLEDIDGWLKKDVSIDLLKTELDGVQENKGLITVLTSNNPEKLPDALLDRPGRFHDVLEFSLPSKELRERMIREWSGVKDFESEEINKLVHYTEGFSGAHMRELIDFARMINTDDGIDLKKALLESLDKIIEQRKLIERIKDSEAKIKSLELKEGRVLSGKNRTLINNAVSVLKQATSALQDLLIITERATSGEGKSLKSRLEEAQEPLKNNRVVVRALQNISGELDQVLSKIKIKKK